MYSKKYYPRLLLIFIIAIAGLSLAPAKKSWVAIGDSITYLNDHQDETKHRLAHGYLTQVTNKLTNFEYINKGYNGWTAGRIADQFDKLAIKKADVYTVFLGTNDWWAGRSIGLLDDFKNNNGSSTVYGSFRMIIDKIRMIKDDAKIILITPMQRTDFIYINNYKNNAYGCYKEKNEQSLEAVALAIIRIGALEGLPVIDLYHNKKMSIPKLVKFKYLRDTVNGDFKKFTYPAYTRIKFNPETDEYPYPPEAMNITYDGLHPSDKGCKIIAGEIIRAFKKIKWN